MCLVRKNTDAPCVATEDIVCYKVAKFRLSYEIGDNGEITQKGTFTGPWWTFDYSINEEYVEPNMEQGIAREGDWMYVNDGFHTYTYLNLAERVAHEKGYDFILECVIPRGASYYVSEGDKEYCSNRIKITGWKHYDEKDWRR